ncbi:MAG: tRNA (N(6)-L-threonylcarbamoyladenosine(37)-C(2))-methylthiotransferase MtaB [Lentisphaerae bacterium]|nr:tRNA (N(6)-L-threonylcarbamoyladenosine(37)-C(2))-methylthiotransferase MtaB [Lentisphaerota bacterium]
MKIYLHNIGCRLNFSELETIARRLMVAGHETVTEPDKADIAIINSCIVTAQAAADTRSAIRRINNSRVSDIWVTACYSPLAVDELQNLGVSLRFVSNEDKELIPELIDPITKGQPADFASALTFRGQDRETGGRTRAFVKVQDGCNNRCTYCITSIARGRERSRPLLEIIDEINARTEAGYKEIVLTGVHLGSYGRDFGTGLSLYNLIHTLLQQTDVPRLRLSSLEPWELTPNFFELWQNKRLMPQLHLPLQSGSDSILKTMARRINTSQFQGLIQTARTAIPDLHVGTDIIAGFPGETEKDFEQTLNFAREMAFARIHVFGYSKRPGTLAATIPMQIPGKIKKERVKRLLELATELSTEFHRQNDGKTRQVLWESAGSHLSGWTDNYVRVISFPLRADLINTITDTLLSKPSASGLQGDPVDAARVGEGSSD